MAPFLPEIVGRLRAFHELDVEDATAAKLCKADFEWTFHLACHNFRKLAGSGWTTTQLATT